MTESILPPLLAAVPTAGSYVNVIKLTVMVVLLVPWLYLMPWISRDAKAMRANHPAWMLGVIGAGVVGIIVWLFVPVFIAGLGVYVVFTAAVMASYVVWRNSHIDDPRLRVMTRDHLKSLFGNAPTLAELTAREVHINVYTHDSRIVPPPDSPETVAVYNAIQDLLGQLLLQRAGEADLTPAGQQSRVRFVIDGVVREQSPLALADSEAAVQYFKAIGGMDVEERRRPQTGKISVDMAGTPVDIELTTTGTTGGQRLRFRVLREVAQLQLDQLGMSKAVQDRVDELIHEPGLILASGKHDSGVTSTLYSLLSGQDAYLKQIMTVEAQMLVDLENVDQHVYAQPSQRPGLLAAGLRRDPDVVLVDECDDPETTALLLKAAAEKSVLLGVGAPDTFVALAKWIQTCGDAAAAVKDLRAVLCQVLIRKLCTECREAYRPNPDLMGKLNLPADVDRLYRPPSQPIVDKKGNPIPCAACRDIGYLGRTGVFELLEITDEIRELVVANAGLSQLKSACRKAGMLYLQEQAVQRVIEGVTDLKEVIRVTQKDKDKGK